MKFEKVAMWECKNK